MNHLNALNTDCGGWGGNASSGRCGVDMPVWVGHSCPTRLVLNFVRAGERLAEFKSKAKSGRTRVSDPHGLICCALLAFTPSFCHDVQVAVQFDRSRQRDAASHARILEAQVPEVD